MTVATDESVHRWTRAARKGSKRIAHTHEIPDVPVSRTRATHRGQLFHCFPLHSPPHRARIDSMAAAGPKSPARPGTNASRPGTSSSKFDDTGVTVDDALRYINEPHRSWESAIRALAVGEARASRRKTADDDGSQSTTSTVSAYSGAASSSAYSARSAVSAPSAIGAGHRRGQLSMLPHRSGAGGGLLPLGMPPAGRGAPAGGGQQPLTAANLASLIAISGGRPPQGSTSGGDGGAAGPALGASGVLRQRRGSGSAHGAPSASALGTGSDGRRGGNVFTVIGSSGSRSAAAMSESHQRGRLGGASTAHIAAGETATRGDDLMVVGGQRPPAAPGGGHSSLADEPGATVGSSGGRSSKGRSTTAAPLVASNASSSSPTMVDTSSALVSGSSPRLAFQFVTPSGPSDATAAMMGTRSNVGSAGGRGGGPQATLAAIPGFVPRIPPRRATSSSAKT